MPINVAPALNFAPFAEAQYQADLQRLARDMADRDLRNRAAEQQMQIQRQQADMAQVAFEEQRRAATEQQRQQQQVAQLPVQAGMPRGQSTGTTGTRAIGQPDNRMMELAIKEAGVNDRTRLRAMADLESDRMRNQSFADRDYRQFALSEAEAVNTMRRSLTKDWQQRLQELDAEDMAYTVQQKRQQNEIFADMNALDNAYAEGTVTADQYAGAFENLQARLFGMEAMPNPTKPKPPSEEEVLSRIFFHPGLGQHVTLKANGDVDVLQDAKAPEQKDTGPTIADVRRRQNELAKVASEGYGESVDPGQFFAEAQRQVTEEHEQFEAAKSGPPKEQAVEPEPEVAIARQVLETPEMLPQVLAQISDPAAQQQVVGLYENARGMWETSNAVIADLEASLQRPPVEVLQNPARRREFIEGINAEIAKQRAGQAAIEASFDDLLQFATGQGGQTEAPAGDNAIAGAVQALANANLSEQQQGELMAFIDQMEAGGPDGQMAADMIRNMAASL